MVKDGMTALHVMSAEFLEGNVVGGKAFPKLASIVFRDEVAGDGFSNHSSAASLTSFSPRERGS
jgi:hypothetical protein